MILSQHQLEEIAASTTKDFNRFFFGDEADKPDRSALPTPIDQFAKNYLGLRVSFARLSPDGSICGVTAYILLIAQETTYNKARPPVETHGGRAFCVLLFVPL